MILQEPKEQIISKRIPPNLSTWQTIELSHQCAKYVIDNNIPGAFVECGVAAGNNLAAMCAAGRHGYGLDSFEGIPWAGENDAEQPGIGKKDESKCGELKSSGISAFSYDDVRANFWNWKIENYSLIKGWFQNTVIDFLEPISVLRLDGDLYDSTLVCLKSLYPWISKGGILIIDDWQLPGCRKAFEDYFISNVNPDGLTIEPILIFNNGVTYWMK